MCLLETYQYAEHCLLTGFFETDGKSGGKMCYM